MKRKYILSAAFVISLLPMLLNQHGGLKGVQEITGLINLLNPIGLLSVLLFVVGVWVPFKLNDRAKMVHRSTVSSPYNNSITRYTYKNKTAGVNTYVNSMF